MFIDIQVDFEIAIFGNESWPLAKVPEVAHVLFQFHVVEIKLKFRSTGSGFWDTGSFSKLSYLGMKLGYWPKFQKLHIYRYSFSTPGGQNWAYFRSTGSGFRDYWRTDSKSAIFSMKLGHCPKFHIHSLSTPRVEIELIFVLQAAVSEILADFQKCLIWAWNLATAKKIQNLHISSLSTPGGRNWGYFALQAAFSKI